MKINISLSLTAINILINKIGLRPITFTVSIKPICNNTKYTVFNIGKRISLVNFNK